MISAEVQDYSSIAQDNVILEQPTPQRGRGRGKRRGGAGRGGRGGGASTSKRAKLEPEPEQPVQVIQQQQLHHQQQQVQQQQILEPQPSEVPADYNNVLKFTYGINAYRHWATQKNLALERGGGVDTSSTAVSRLGPGAGRMKPFKLDLLQCSADELNCALCLFVKEVHKPNGEEYAPDSIYYLCLGGCVLYLSQ